MACLHLNRALTSGEYRCVECGDAQKVIGTLFGLPIVIDPDLPRQTPTNIVLMSLDEWQRKLRNDYWKQYLN